MFKMSVESNLGDVVVKTTERRGLSPEELAELWIVTGKHN